MAENYSYGTLPVSTNPVRVELVKMLTATGGNTIRTGTGAPVSNPTNTGSIALYVDLTAGDLYVWQVDTQKWV